MKIDMWDSDGLLKKASYENVSLSGESDGYRLTTDGFSSDPSFFVRNSLPSQSQFSHGERDGDSHPTLNCASDVLGAPMW